MSSLWFLSVFPVRHIPLSTPCLCVVSCFTSVSYITALLCVHCLVVCSNLCEERNWREAADVGQDVPVVSVWIQSNRKGLKETAGIQIFLTL